MSPARVEPDIGTYSGRLAARMRALREEADITGAELVTLINKHGFSIKLSAYSHWETGERKTNLDAIPAIAKALKLKPHDLLPEK